MCPETVVCWKWTPRFKYRSTFGPEQVNTLQRMVKRHFDRPHRFVCVTDNTTGLDPQVEAIPLWADYADLPSPHGGHNPSCYRRLRAFHPEIGSVLGRRFVSVDLDVVITRDLVPVWDRDEDFVIWGDTNPTTAYNGGMFLLTAGARPQVWTDFNPKQSPQKAKAAGQWGSDQGWISYCLGPHEAKWTTRDGVYSYRNHLRGRPLPTDARIVLFHGSVDPWSPAARVHPWVVEHWR